MLYVSFKRAIICNRHGLVCQSWGWCEEFRWKYDLRCLQITSCKPIWFQEQSGGNHMRYSRFAFSLWFATGESYSYSLALSSCVGIIIETTMQDISNESHKCAKNHNETKQNPCIYFVRYSVVGNIVCIVTQSDQPRHSLVCQIWRRLEESRWKCDV